MIIDAGGTVRHASSVSPAGQRDIAALVAICEEIDRDWSGGPLLDAVAPKGLPEGGVLYVKDHCMFSRWALYARTNLHLEDALPMVNVSHDPEALTELQRRGGKGQTPALAIGDQVLYESADIARFLATHASWT